MSCSESGRHDSTLLGAAIGVAARSGRALAPGARAFEVLLGLTGRLAADDSRWVGNRLNPHGGITDGNLLGLRPARTTWPSLATGVSLQPCDLNALRLIDRATARCSRRAHGSLRASAPGALSTSLLRSTWCSATLGSTRLLLATGLPSLRTLSPAGLTLSTLLLALISLRPSATSLLLLRLPAGSARHLRVLILLPSRLALADVLIARQLKLSEHSVFRLLLGLLRGTIEQSRIRQRAAGRARPRRARCRGRSRCPRRFGAHACRVSREAGAGTKRGKCNTPKTVVDESGGHGKRILSDELLHVIVTVGMGSVQFTVGWQGTITMRGSIRNATGVPQKRSRSCRAQAVVPSSPAPTRPRPYFPPPSSLLNKSAAFSVTPLFSRAMAASLWFSSLVSGFPRVPETCNGSVQAE